MRASRLTALVLVAALVTAGCDGEAAPAADATVSRSAPTPPRRDSLAAALADAELRSRPGYVVDSVRTPEEEQRRFRAGLGEAPTRLANGARSGEALARAVLAGLARRDTARLAGLLLTRAEFAYLVYPTSPFVRPPFRQPPELVWMQLAAGRGAGLRRLMDRLGGRELRLDGLTCDARPVVEGENRLWRNCRAAYRVDGRAREGRLFGVIVEREGRFKLASYENDF